MYLYCIQSYTILYIRSEYIVHMNHVSSGPDLAYFYPGPRF